MYATLKGKSTLIHTKKSNSFTLSNLFQIHKLKTSPFGCRGQTVKEKSQTAGLNDRLAGFQHGCFWVEGALLRNVWDALVVVG